MLLLLNIPVIFLLFKAEAILVLIRQNPEVASNA